MVLLSARLKSLGCLQNSIFCLAFTQPEYDKVDLGPIYKVLAS